MCLVLYTKEAGRIARTQDMTLYCTKFPAWHRRVAGFQSSGDHSIYIAREAQGRGIHVHDSYLYNSKQFSGLASSTWYDLPPGTMYPIGLPKLNTHVRILMPQGFEFEYPERLTYWVERVLSTWNLPSSQSHPAIGASSEPTQKWHTDLCRPWGTHRTQARHYKHRDPTQDKE